MGSIMLNGISYTSGGADVEANPQDTPSDTLSTIGIDGVVYEIEGGGGGGGNAYGAFIDTNRVIKASTAVPPNTDVTYTATEDCCVEFSLVANSNQGVQVSIDGVNIKANYISSGIYTWGDIVYLRRGQTIKMRQSYTSADGSYIVYGLTFGTQNIFTPQIYSTEERCVGVWIDNKPLYARTIIHTGALNSVNDWTLYDDSVSYDTLIRANVVRINTNGEITPNANTFENNPRFNVKADHKLYYYTNNTITATYIYISLLYTKTTDTAGSGSYNTLGVPTRHYDTTEKVVGTVEMDNGIIKPLYEKSWWLTTPSQSGGYTFPNTSMADLDQVISNEYSFDGKGMRSYTYWYSGASVVFDEHTSSGISFYFGSSDYSGRMIFYTARYTKTTD